MKENKLNDINTLLKKHYGENWQVIDKLSSFKVTFEKQQVLLYQPADSEGNIRKINKDETELDT